MLNNTYYANDIPLDEAKLIASDVIKAALNVLEKYHWNKPVNTVMDLWQALWIISERETPLSLEFDFHKRFRKASGGDRRMWLVDILSENAKSTFSKIKLRWLITDFIYNNNNIPNPTWDNLEANSQFKLEHPKHDEIFTLAFEYVTKAIELIRQANQHSGINTDF